jgi:hypothetical protein
MILRQLSGGHTVYRPGSLRWTGAIIMLALASFGWVLRQGNAVPFLHGTWLSSSILHITGSDQSQYLGVPYAGIWMWTVLAGFLSTLWVGCLDSRKDSRASKMIKYSSKLFFVATVFCAVSWFAWPFSMLIPLAVVLAFVSSISNIALFALSFSSKHSFSENWIAYLGNTLSGIMLALVVLDWLNMLLIGVS